MTLLKGRLKNLFEFDSSFVIDNSDDFGHVSGYNYGYGYGYGYGDVDGDGSGCGDGYGYNYIDGYGAGYGVGTGTNPSSKNWTAAGAEIENEV